MGVFPTFGNISLFIEAQSPIFCRHGFPQLHNFHILPAMLLWILHSKQACPVLLLSLHVTDTYYRYSCSRLPVRYHPAGIHKPVKTRHKLPDVPILLLPLSYPDTPEHLCMLLLKGYKNISQTLPTILGIG